MTIQRACVRSAQSSSDFVSCVRRRYRRRGASSARRMLNASSVLDVYRSGCARTMPRWWFVSTLSKHGHVSAALSTRRRLRARIDISRNERLYEIHFKCTCFACMNQHAHITPRTPAARAASRRRRAETHPPRGRARCAGARRARRRCRRSGCSLRCPGARQSPNL